MNTTTNRRSPMTPGERLMFLAGILFCLVLITTSMMGGLFARYTTTGTSSDSARVAKFGDLTLTESGDFGADGSEVPKIIPGVDLTKKVEISFTGSEMATVVFVKAELTGGWKSADSKNFSLNGTMNWSVADGWPYLSNDGSSYVYYKELAPNTTLDKVSFIANDGKITVSNTLTESSVNSMTSISISLQASVIQSGGFADAAAAWAYLNK